MKLRKCFEFSGEEHFFQGHFPGSPILPGVLQIQLAHRAAEELFGRRLTMKSVRRMKFVHVIEPRQKLTLELSSEDDTSVEYRWMRGERLCSSGVLSY